MHVEPDKLNALMEFQHVIRVHEDGAISEPTDVYAPDVYWVSDAVDMAGADAWSLMDGYSQQDRYSGPVMHPSEYIGRRMAEDILTTPGYYAAVMVEDIDDPDDPAGWAVAYRES